MINKIKNAIIAKLKECFPLFEVYTAPVEQGARPPCFFVTWRKTTETQRLGKIYNRVYSFDVDYLTAGGNILQDESISEDLFNVLEFITVDGRPLQVYSSEINAAYIPFTFSVSYRLSIEKNGAQLPFIQSYKMETSPKE